MGSHELVEQLTHAPRHGVNARSLLLEQALAAEDDADDVAQLAKVDQLKQKAHLRKIYHGCEGLMRDVPVAERALVDYVARAKVTRAPRQLILDRLAAQHLALALFKDNIPATPEAVAARHELRRAALQQAKQQELEIFQQHRAAPAELAARPPGLAASTVSYTNDVTCALLLQLLCKELADWTQIYANAAAKASAADKVLQLEAAEAAAAEAVREDARQRHRRKAEAAIERHRRAKLAKSAAGTVLLEAELEWDGDSDASPGSAQQQQPVPEVQPASAGTSAEQQGTCYQAGEPHSGAGSHAQPTQSANPPQEQPQSLQREGGCAGGGLQEEQECTDGRQPGACAAIATDGAEPSAGEAAGRPPAASPADSKCTVVGAQWRRTAIKALVLPHCDQVPGASVAADRTGARGNTRQPRSQPATGEEPDNKELLQAVQGFVLGHLAPLEGAGLVSTEVKELVVQKATDKIVQTHKQANTLTFLLHEGQRIRGLIDRYVLWAQQKLKTS